MARRTIALFGDSGAGKTTLGGELAKSIYKSTKKRTRYYGADSGGYESIRSLEEVGVLDVIRMGEDDDPWVWCSRAARGQDMAANPLPDDIGLVIYDSGTYMAEALLRSCAALSADGQDIGGRPAPKFTIGRNNDTPLTVGTNVDSHYMAVQNYMTDVLWRSGWLGNDRVDVLWTFSVHRGEKNDSTPILGPKLAGKALTPAIPKWFHYIFRVTSDVSGGDPIHRLYLQEHPELAGMGVSFGNARYPLDATTPLPTYIEPASLVAALELIDQGQKEALEKLRVELQG